MERKTGAKSPINLYIQRGLVLLALTAILVLCISGCDEDIFGDEESDDSETYLLPQHSLAWSPDGSMLAYIYDTLLVVKVIETDELRSLTGSGTYDNPTWSPDSVKIAYSSSSYVERSSIWTKNADGSTIAKRITASTWADYHPRWSPDGTKIAFHSRRSSNASTEIWIRNADGSGEDMVVASASDVDQNAEWSPDSTMLVFESKRSENGDFDIWIARIDDTSPPVQITFDEAPDEDPIWSPDGTRIAFQSERDGSQGIWVKSTDASGDAIQINTGYPDAGMHDWSPDSNWIAFVSDETIYVKRSDGTGVAAEIGTGFYPHWSPDGQTMALVTLMEGEYEIQIVDLPADIGQ